jgi:hypothetical protein
MFWRKKEPKIPNQSANAKNTHPNPTPNTESSHDKTNISPNRRIDSFVLFWQQTASQRGIMLNF